MIVLLIGVSDVHVNLVNLALHLRWPQADLLVTGDADDGLKLAERERPHLIILGPAVFDDVLLDTLGRLRQSCEGVLAVLGEGKGEVETVRALEAGADEYFHTMPTGVELVARLAALIRRSRRVPGGGDVSLLSAGKSGIALDGDAQEFTMDGKTVRLTPTEFRLLHTLVRNSPQVVSRRVLERLLWEDHQDGASLLKKYIQRLRRKLGDDPGVPSMLVNVRNVGYRFVVSRLSNLSEGVAPALVPAEHIPAPESPGRPGAL